MTIFLSRSFSNTIYSPRDILYSVSINVCGILVGVESLPTHIDTLLVLFHKF